jgi:hypothetical protein
MTHTATNVGGNKWLVAVDFTDEGVNASASNHVIGTKEQAEAYAVTLARDFRENHMELFPLPPVEEHDHMMEGM